MKITIPLFLAFLCLSVAATAHAQYSITRCGTIISNAGLYVLANDLGNWPGVGIEIRSNGNIGINLNHHQITGASGATVGILARLLEGPFTPVSISSGTISGFSNAGIEFYSGGEFRVTSVTYTRNGTGIKVNNGGHGVLSNNTASGNGRGFEIDTSSTTVKNNRATGNANEGFLITGQANRVYIRQPLLCPLARWLA